MPDSLHNRRMCKIKRIQDIVTMLGFLIILAALSTLINVLVK